MVELSQCSLDLPFDSVHVWTADLGVCDSALTSLQQTLSFEERERAAAYRHAEHRRRFVAARAFLREVLGRYKRIPANEVRFRYEPNGKPLLQDTSDLQFNLSHSEDMACTAVARRRRLGVDVEVIRENRDFLGLARRFFAPSEAALVEQAQGADRARVFLAYWTCKEACLKASGDGILSPVNEVEVAFSLTGDEVKLATCDPDRRRPWTVRRWRFGDGIAAAIAVEREGWRLSIASWHLNRSSAA